jgi:hypothetical protein
MREEIVFDDTCESCVSDCSGYFFSTLNAGILFAVDKFGKATSTKSMIARLNGNRYGHDFIAKRAGYLIFDGLRELADHYFFLLFFLFLFLSSLYSFGLFLVLLFLLLLFLFLFLFLSLLLFLLHSFLIFSPRSQL